MERGGDACCDGALQAMKTVEKKGLQAMAKAAGLDLYSLPFEDARPQRLEWLAQQPTHPPMVLHSHVTRITPPNWLSPDCGNA